MSNIFKKSEEIQELAKELMLDAPEVEKWGPSQEGRAEYKPPLDEIEKGLLEEASLDPVKKVHEMEVKGEEERRRKLKEEGRLGLQEDKKFISEIRKAGIDPQKEFEKSGQVHKPLEGIDYEIKARQRHNPPL